MIETRVEELRPRTESVAQSAEVSNQIGDPQVNVVEELMAKQFEAIYWRKEMSDGTMFLKRLTPDGKCKTITEYNGKITRDGYDMNALGFPVPRRGYVLQMFKRSNWRLMRNYEYLDEGVLRVESPKPVLSYVTEIAVKKNGDQMSSLASEFEAKLRNEPWPPPIKRTGEKEVTVEPAVQEPVSEPVSNEAPVPGLLAEEPVAKTDTEKTPPPRKTREVKKPGLKESKMTPSEVRVVVLRPGQAAVVYPDQRTRRELGPAGFVSKKKKDDEDEFTQLV